MMRIFAILGACFFSSAVMAQFYCPSGYTATDWGAVVSNETRTDVDIDVACEMAEAASRVLTEQTIQEMTFTDCPYPAILVTDEITGPVEDCNCSVNVDTFTCQSDDVIQGFTCCELSQK